MRSGEGKNGMEKIMPPARIELATFALQVQRSTTKLRRRVLYGILEWQDLAGILRDIKI